MRGAWRRIEAAGMKGMTPAEPAQREPAAPPHAVHFDGFERVVRAGGIETATAPQVRAQRELIKTDQEAGRRNALLLHLAPELFDPGTQFRIGSTRASADGRSPRYRLGAAGAGSSGKTRDTTRRIRLRSTGTAGELRRHGHAQTRMAFVIPGAQSRLEEPVPHAPAARVYRFELGLPPQAPLRGKSESPCWFAARARAIWSRGVTVRAREASGRDSNLRE